MRPLQRALPELEKIHIETGIPVSKNYHTDKLAKINNTSTPQKVIPKARKPQIEEANRNSLQDNVLHTHMTQNEVHKQQHTSPVRLAVAQVPARSQAAKLIRPPSETPDGSGRQRQSLTLSELARHQPPISSHTLYAMQTEKTAHRVTPLSITNNMNRVRTGLGYSSEQFYDRISLLTNTSKLADSRRARKNQRFEIALTRQLRELPRQLTRAPLYLKMADAPEEQSMSPSMKTVMSRTILCGDDNHIRESNERYVFHLFRVKHGCELCPSEHPQYIHGPQRPTLGAQPQRAGHVCERHPCA